MTPNIQQYPDLRRQGIEVLGTLARGGQGTLLNCLDNGRRVVIKAARTEGQAGLEALTREQRTGYYLSDQINDPRAQSIVRIDRIIDGPDSRVYIVMPLIPGPSRNAAEATAAQTFKDRILEIHCCHDPSEARAGLLAALRQFRDLCTSLQFCHENGIIHLDVKPGNVLINATTEQILLSDFGLGEPSRTYFRNFAIAPGPGFKELMQKQNPQLRANADDTLTRNVGTTYYMAPEVFNSNSPLVDWRADIFSLGVVLYQIISGSLPFQSLEESLTNGPIDEVEYYKKLAEHGAPKLSFAGFAIEEDGSTSDHREIKVLSSGEIRDLQAVVRRALQADPMKRYQKAAELATEIEHFLTHYPVGENNGLARRLHLGIGRNSKPLLIAAASLVLGGVGVGGFNSLAAAERAGEQRRVFDHAWNDALSEFRAGNYSGTVGALQIVEALSQLDPELKEKHRGLSRVTNILSTVAQDYEWLCAVRASGWGIPLERRQAPDTAPVLIDSFEGLSKEAYCERLQILFAKLKAVYGTGQDPVSMLTNGTVESVTEPFQKGVGQMLFFTMADLYIHAKIDKDRGLLGPNETASPFWNLWQKANRDGLFNVEMTGELTSDDGTSIGPAEIAKGKGFEFVLQTFLEWPPRSPSEAVLCSEISFLQGNLAMARQQAREGLRLFPDNRDIPSWLEFMSKVASVTKSK